MSIICRIKNFDIRTNVVTMLLLFFLPLFDRNATQLEELFEKNVDRKIEIYKFGELH